MTTGAEPRKGGDEVTFDLTEYIRTELFVLVPVLYVLGMLLKKSPLRDWLIPFVLCGTGIVLSFAFFAGSGEAMGKTLFASVTQGVLCAACSVFAHNVIKQFKNRKSESDETQDSETGEK